ncbi:hypothetical protein SEMRO_1531_G280180.1 [Seminavis robusta]|uniref:Uncharacterized protein n=1 Tax=Seminavis robusta TaxID=568900 RepID=A0A9N8ERX8_9STRA|nr:hypothetical protein SEMRO_1531_G280180.1 [Seminavis robusta]|eukprot:Sro1531_g280180.1 n/a (140) ;mRNA; r:15431-16077
MLSEEGFLADGLCIFGDAAYINNGFFATPFKNVKSGIKDDYNFYHSQKEEVPEMLASDEAEIRGQGAVPLERTEMNEASPGQLLGGGDHHGDTSESLRQQFRRVNKVPVEPREKMVRQVERLGLKRPIPARWSKKEQNS